MILTGQEHASKMKTDPHTNTGTHIKNSLVNDERWWERQTKKIHIFCHRLIWLSLSMCYNSFDSRRFASETSKVCGVCVLWHIKRPTFQSCIPTKVINHRKRAQFDIQTPLVDRHTITIVITNFTCDLHKQILFLSLACCLSLSLSVACSPSPSESGLRLITPEICSKASIDENERKKNHFCCTATHCTKTKIHAKYKPEFRQKKTHTHTRQPYVLLLGEREKVALDGR